MDSDNLEYSLSYWTENFIRDVEAFNEFWRRESERHGGEFPDRLSLLEWDRQFIQWLGGTTTDRQN